MTVEELLAELKRIITVHPEVNEAEVWFEGLYQLYHVRSIGYDKKHKPSRLKLYD